MDPNQVTQEVTNTSGFVHPLIQTLLLFILPIIMQGMKKIRWVELNKAWACPLLCIAAATGAAYYMQLPQWLLVGIMTGAACNKIYDWSKDIGLRQSSIISMLIILLFVFVSGCVGEVSTQKQQCLVATKVFTGAVEELTLCKQLGLFSENEINEISIVIEGGQNCLNQWHEALKDPNTTTYEQWPLCVNEAVIKLLTYESKARGGDNQ
jgi:hypothetical protein